jgi:hypothetical protein
MVYSLSGDIYYVPSLPPSSNSLGFFMVTALHGIQPILKASCEKNLKIAYRKAEAD